MSANLATEQVRSNDDVSSACLALVILGFYVRILQ